MSSDVGRVKEKGAKVYLREGMACMGRGEVATL
jgi:hypothetical protein